MSSSKEVRRCLVVLDAQEWILGLDLHPYDGPQLTNSIRSLVDTYRAASDPIIWVQFLRLDGSDGGTQGGGRIVKACGIEPGDQVVTKFGVDAFLGTTLNSKLKELGVRDLTLAGVSTAHAVQQTAVSGAALGFEIKIYAPACSSLSLIEHQRSLEGLSNVPRVNVLETEIQKGSDNGTNCNH